MIYKVTRISYKNKGDIYEIECLGNFQRLKQAQNFAFGEWGYLTATERKENYIEIRRCRPTGIKCPYYDASFEDCCETCEGGECAEKIFDRYGVKPNEY